MPLNSQLGLSARDAAISTQSGQHVTCQKRTRHKEIPQSLELKDCPSRLSYVQSSASINNQHIL